ncbi:hypothetical protein, partial [Campylobacter jejuni]
ALDAELEEKLAKAINEFKANHL